MDYCDTNIHVRMKPTDFGFLEGLSKAAIIIISLNYTSFLEQLISK